MSQERLGRDDWVKAGLRALARSGFTALKADTLAKTLGVSRGSFYWHFADVEAFHGAVLRRWRQVALDSIVAELEATGGDRWLVLIRRALTERSTLESAVRAWAFADERARAAVDAVDGGRVRHLRKYLVEAGVDPKLAHSRAHILNWAYLGRSISRRLRTEELEAVIAEVANLIRLPTRMPG